MDKLNIIKNSIEQIREAIGEPCDHIENLPEKINELVEDASKVGYSTVFVFSNKENPNKPTGTLYENGIVSDLDDNWSQTKIEDSGKVWMSFSLFKQSGGQVSDWVTPLLITGKDGKDAFTPQFKIEDGFWYIQYSENGEWVKVGQATGTPGKDGADGKDGIQGPQGEPGKNGVDGAPGQDGTDGEDGKDGSDGKDGVDGEPGRGIVSVEKLFAVNNNPSNYPDEGWTIIENVSTSPTNRYMWCKETTTFTSGEPTVIHYIVAIEGEPGVNGTGNDGPIIYPAGVWDDEKTYISVASDPKNNVSGKVPYVFYASEDANEGYYVLKEGATPPIGTVPTNKTYWDPIDSFEAIYSDIGLFNQALVGKWVFHGDYMFSQDGVDASGNPKKYSDFTDPKFAIDNGEFIPNICLNAVTGEGWFAGKNIVFNKDGSGYVGNKTIEWSNEYSLINESSCTIDVYGAKNPEIWHEPIPKTNVLHINAIAGNGDIGYNKSYELVLNLSNYKFVGENLKITNYSNKLIYLHCDASGGNAKQYFMKEGFDVHWGDNNVSTNYGPNFIETFVLQSYSEVQFRLVTVPSLYTTEGSQYIIVITPVSYFYRNNQQCLTNTSVYDFDFDLKLNSLSKNNFEFDTCTNEDQHRVFQWSDINFDFIRAIEDGDREFIDDSEQVQLKIYEGEEEKITVDGFANKFIKTNDLKNAECFINIDTRPYWRFQLYYKNVCFAELKSTVNSHSC